MGRGRLHIAKKKKGPSRTIRRWLSFLGGSDENAVLRYLNHHPFTLGGLVFTRPKYPELLNTLYKKKWYRVMDKLIQSHGTVLMTEEAQMLIPKMLANSDYPTSSLRNWILDSYPQALQSTKVYRAFIPLFPPSLFHWPLYSETYPKGELPTQRLKVMDSLIQSTPEFFTEWAHYHQEASERGWWVTIFFLMTSPHKYEYLNRIPDELLARYFADWLPALFCEEDYSEDLANRVWKQKIANFEVTQSPWRDRSSEYFTTDSDRDQELSIERVDRMDPSYTLPTFSVAYFKHLVQRDQEAGTVMQEEYWNRIDWSKATLKSFFTLSDGWKIRICNSCRYPNFIRQFPLPYQRYLIHHLCRLIEEEHWIQQILPVSKRLGAGYESWSLYQLYQKMFQLIGRGADAHWGGVPNPLQNQEYEDLKDIYVEQVMSRGLYTGGRMQSSYHCYYGDTLIPKIAQSYWDQIEQNWEQLPGPRFETWNPFLKDAWREDHRYPVAIQQQVLRHRVRDREGQVRPLLQRLEELGGRFQNYCWGGRLFSEGSNLLWSLVQGKISKNPSWAEVVTLGPEEYALEELNQPPPENLTGNPLFLQMLTEPKMFPHLVSWSKNNFQVRMQRDLYLHQLWTSGRFLQYPHLIPVFLGTEELGISLPTTREWLSRLVQSRVSPTARELLEQVRVWLTRPLDITLPHCQLCTQAPQHLQLECCPHRICLACNQWCHRCPWCQTQNSSFHLLPMSPDSLWSEVLSGMEIKLRDKIEK